MNSELTREWRKWHNIIVYETGRPPPGTSTATTAVRPTPPLSPRSASPSAPRPSTSSPAGPAATARPRLRHARPPGKNGSPRSSPASPRATGAATSSPCSWASSPGTCSPSSANGHGWASSPAPASAFTASTRHPVRHPRQTRQTLNFAALLRGCGRSSLTLPARRQDRAATRKDPDEQSAQPDGARSHRARSVRPLDNGGPYGCRSAVGRVLLGLPAVLRLYETRRVKYAIFRRDPRAQLLIDDSTGFRAVLVPATAEIREDTAAELPRFRAIREKHGMAVPDDDEHLRALPAEGRSCWPSHRPSYPRPGPDGPGLTTQDPRASSTAAICTPARTAPVSAHSAYRYPVVPLLLLAFFAPEPARQLSIDPCGCGLVCWAHGRAGGLCRPGG